MTRDVIREPHYLFYAAYFPRFMIIGIGIAILPVFASSRKELIEQSPSQES